MPPLLLPPASLPTTAATIARPHAPRPTLKAHSGSMKLTVLPSPWRHQRLTFGRPLPFILMAIRPTSTTPTTARCGHRQQHSKVASTKRGVPSGAPLFCIRWLPESTAANGHQCLIPLCSLGGGRGRRKRCSHAGRSCRRPALSPRCRRSRRRARRRGAA